MLLLGVLLGFVASVIANLVTPFMRPLWVKLLSLQRRGYHAQIRQQIKALQIQLDQLNARKAGPEKDLYLELFQWSLGIFSIFVAAVACAFLGMTASDASVIVRDRLFKWALIFLTSAVVLSLFMVSYGRGLTSKGMEKRIAKLEADIAKLTAKLLVT
jgi:hypothetical protein